MIFQFYWPQTEPNVPISHTTNCQYLQFSKLKLSLHPQFKKYQNSQIFLNSNCLDATNSKSIKKLPTNQEYQNSQFLKLRLFRYP